MLAAFIAITIAAAIALWIISTRRRLAALDQNSCNAMSQVGVQLSCRFDALMAFLDATKDYAGVESETLIETIKSKRSVITATSAPDDVMRQERAIAEALDRIATEAKQCPDLKTDQKYIKAMDALQVFENMMRTSRLIYNDSVTRLNREIRMFPVSMVAGMLGFGQRKYLVEQTDMPHTT